MDVRVLKANELQILENIAEDVFDNPIDPTWSAEFFADPRHHLAVAIHDSQIVGMASAVHYVHPDKPPELWINEVGVSPKHQGKGIGKKLLNTLFKHGKELGCVEAWVLTEGDNIAAQRLYTSVGGQEEKEPPVYFTFLLNE